mmetsp:Transcript_27558/g.31733  ORF Transcript_27558/g.31733 Transcript_27558/m.31733 type:complete len:88 (-) Transcript_27558:311-574(-)
MTFEAGIVQKRSNSQEECYKMKRSIKKPKTVEKNRISFNNRQPQSLFLDSLRIVLEKIIGKKLDWVPGTFTGQVSHCLKQYLSTSRI